MTWLQQIFPRLVMSLLIVVASGWFGVRLYRSWVQERAVIALRGIDDCKVSYDTTEVEHLDFLKPQNSLPPVTWIEAIFGKHFIHRAELVQLPVDRVDEALVHIERLPYLRKVEVYALGDPIAGNLDIGASRIRNALPSVETIAVSYNFNTEYDRIPRE
jgi:hypothetical protein